MAKRNQGTGSSAAAAIELSVKPDGITHFHFFNRYCVRKIEGGLLVDFGLTDGNSVLDSVTMLYCQEAYKKQKANIEEYFGKLAQDNNPPLDQCIIPAWTPSANVRKVYAIDFIGLTQVGNDAAIDLYSISIRRVSDLISTRSKGPIEGIPQVGLRSSILAHKAFLKELVMEKWSQ